MNGDKEVVRDETALGSMSEKLKVLRNGLSSAEHNLIGLCSNLSGEPCDNNNGCDKAEPGEGRLKDLESTISELQGILIGIERSIDCLENML